MAEYGTEICEVDGSRGRAGKKILRRSTSLVRTEKKGGGVKG